MNLTNKLLAGFTAMSTVVMSIAPIATFADDYTEDSVYPYGATVWAINQGVTANSTVASAAPFANITREQFAAIAVRGFDAIGVDLTADDTLNCEYADLDSASAGLQDYVVEACQKGLFQDADDAVSAKFNPKATVSEAVVSVIFCKALAEDSSVCTADAGEAFYAAANARNIENDVMSQEKSNAKMATRGMVFQMFKNVADMIDDGSVDPTVPPTTGTTNTGSTTVEVKAWTLNVALNAGSTLANNTQIPSTGVVRFAAVDFSAGASDVTLRTVEVAKLGLATIPSSTRVWFERNGVRVTGKAAFTSEGKAVVSFAPSLVVKANSTESLDLYVELATNPGFDFQFQSAALDSSAQTVNGSFTTPVLRTVAYQVINSVVAKSSTGTTSSVTTNGMELGAFQVTINNVSSETRNAMFKSVTLRQAGNASLSSLSNIVLERNGTVVASNPTINGRDITFSLNNTILDATTATYYIKALVNNVEQATDTYQFEVRNTTDMSIVEANTAFRTTISYSPAASSLSLGAYSIQGGDITFSRDTSVALSNSVAPGTTNVVFMQGTLKTNAAVTVEDPTVAYLNGLTDSGAFAKFSTVYLQIGGSTFSYSPAAGGTATAATFLGTATINGTVAVKMWATLKQTATAGSVKFGSLQLGSFARAEYVSNGNQVTTAVGSIEGVNVTVESSVLNVTRTDGKGNTTIAKGTSDYTVLKMSLTSNQGNGVRVSRANFGVVATGNYMSGISLSLLVNGQVVQTKNVEGSTIFFDSFNTNVTQASGTTLEVKANFPEAYASGDFQLTLAANTGLTAVDSVTSATVNHSAVSSAVFTIGNTDAQVSASNSPVLSKLLLSPSTFTSISATDSTAIMAFRVKALNDSVSLRDVAFSGTNLDKLNDFRIVDSSNNVISTSATIGVTNTEVTFKSIPSAPVIAKDGISTYYLVANVNSNTTGTVSAVLNSMVVKGSNGNFVSASPFAPIPSNVHALAESTLMVSKVTNPSKEIGSSALVFNVKVSGKDSITLTGLTVKISTAGYSGDKVTVYKNSIGAANIAFETISYTNGVDAVWTTYNASNATVDVGVAGVNYIIVLDNARGDWTNATQSWTARLSDVFFDGIAGTSYNNVGLFPLTEVK